MKQSFPFCTYCRDSEFVTAQETAHRVLYHEDIDLTKMNNLAKVEEEQHKNRYLSYAEQQKHKEK
jgi:hypothetical protein